MPNMEATPFPPAAHRLGESASWVVGVIDDSAEVDRAVQLLDRFRAHRVKHFGRWVLTDHRD